MLGPVDPRDVIDTKTRLRTPTTDQSSRRPPHRHLVSWSLLRGLPLTLTHRRRRLEWCLARGNWTVAEWNQVGFSYESRFNLSIDDNHARVCTPRGERLGPAFALQRHTAPTAGVMV
ncbi:transposable element Tcb1 transposase [Trichonephila clavipes]|nr:transposable element Tcb1 transposase [Trichonephila clavipes]